jgi:hypothetical protein
VRSAPNTCSKGFRIRLPRTDCFAARARSGVRLRLRLSSVRIYTSLLRNIESGGI